MSTPRRARLTAVLRPRPRLSPVMIAILSVITSAPSFVRGILLNLRSAIAHVLEIREQRGSGRVPSQLASSLCTGRQGVPAHEKPEEGEMLLGLFLRDGNDRYVQAVADDGSDVFERHPFFGDGVMPVSRRTLLQGEPVETGDIGYMRSRPTVISLANVR